MNFLYNICSNTLWLNLKIWCNYEVKNKNHIPKKGKMMIMIAIGKPKKANKGAIMNVANKLEKASKAHAGQAKTLKSLKVRGGGMAVQGMNFKGIY